MTVMQKTETRQESFAKNKTHSGDPLPGVTVFTRLRVPSLEYSTDYDTGKSVYCAHTRVLLSSIIASSGTLLSRKPCV